MSDTCLNCQGLIPEPNRAYGYAGPICSCPVNPQYQFQRPASKERRLQMGGGERKLKHPEWTYQCSSFDEYEKTIANILTKLSLAMEECALIEELRAQNAALLEDNAAMKAALNKIGIAQMGELDYTQDFFELTKMVVRETLAKLKVKNGV